MKWIFAAVSIMLASSAQADFGTAMQAYEAENYPPAYQEFLFLSKIGHAGAQFNLSVMLMKGQGTAKDLAQAYAWATIADESGFPNAQKVIKALDKKADAATQASYRKAAEALKVQYGKASLQAVVYPDFGTSRLVDGIAPRREDA